MIEPVITQHFYRGSPPFSSCLLISVFIFFFIFKGPADFILFVARLGYSTRPNRRESHRDDGKEIPEQRGEYHHTNLFFFSRGAGKVCVT